MNTDDFKNKYGLKGPLSKIYEENSHHQKLIDSKIAENFRKERILAQKNEPIFFEPAKIISPITGSNKKNDNESEDTESNQTKVKNIYNVRPASLIRTGKTYSSIEEYVNEKVQQDIITRKLQKYQDFSIYVEGQNITKKANPLPIDFNEVKVKEEVINVDKADTSFLRAQSYVTRYNSIYKKANKFIEQQAKTIDNEQMIIKERKNDN